MIKARMLIPAAMVFFGIAAGCSAARSRGDHSLSFVQDPGPGKATLLWSRALKGTLSDLAVSRDGGSVWVATAPDNEVEDGLKVHYLHRISARGEIQWRLPTQAKVRNLSVSKNGELAVIATVDERVVAVDGKGRPLWELEAICRPYVLSRSRKVICYHDDDAEPDVAFDLYDWKGKKIHSQKIDDDVLALKHSEDDLSLAFGLNQGRILKLGPGSKAGWSNRLQGEIQDVAVSSGNATWVAVLFENHKKGQEPVQHIAVLEPDGKVFSQGEVRIRAEQIEISADAKTVYAYGNSPAGQYLGSYVIPENGGALLENWKLSDTRAADYSTPMIATPSWIFMSFEDLTPGVRHSHVLGFGTNGKMKWNIPVPTPEGGYLYAFGYSQDTGALVTGTDEGQISLFKLDP